MQFNSLKDIEYNLDSYLFDGDTPPIKTYNDAKTTKIIMTHDKNYVKDFSFIDENRSVQEFRLIRFAYNCNTNYLYLNVETTLGNKPHGEIKDSFIYSIIKGSSYPNEDKDKLFISGINNLNNLFQLYVNRLNQLI